VFPHVFSPPSDPVGMKEEEEEEEGRESTVWYRRGDISNVKAAVIS